MVKNMHKMKVNLVTMKDCTGFVEAVSRVNGRVVLEDGNGFRVNGKSLLGALAAVEWENLWVVSDEDIYFAISEWVL